MKALCQELLFLKISKMKTNGQINRHSNFLWQQGKCSSATTSPVSNKIYIKSHGIKLLIFYCHEGFMSRTSFLNLWNVLKTYRQINRPRHFLWQQRNVVRQHLFLYQKRFTLLSHSGSVLSNLFFANKDT